MFCNIFKRFKSQQKKLKAISRIEMLEQTPLKSQFINFIMKDGKKLRATKIVEQVIREVDYQEAIKLASPIIKTVSQRKGKRNVAVPYPLRTRQQIRIGIKWIAEQASKHAMPFANGLILEMKNIIKGTSPILQRRENLHKQALQNRSNLIMFDRK